MPLALSKPAGLSTAPTDSDTECRIWFGFQPSSPIFLIAMAANFGVEKFTNKSTLAALSFRICASIVGSLLS